MRQSRSAGWEQTRADKVNKGLKCTMVSYVQISQT